MAGLVGIRTSVIARRTSKRAALDGATRPTLLEFDSVADPTWIAPSGPQAFRIQFVCGTHDRGPTNLTEKHIEVEDTSVCHASISLVNDIIARNMDPAHNWMFKA